MLCSCSVFSNFIVNTYIILCYCVYCAIGLLCVICICIISCIMSSPAELAMSTSGIKICPLVPAEEVPHGRHQDWLLEYVGE